MERKLNRASAILLTTGFIITGIILALASGVPGYLGRALAFSAAFILTATLVQLLQTSRGYIDEGHFSAKRWVTQALIIFFLITLVEAVPNPEARIKTLMLVTALAITAAFANKARKEGLPHDKAWVIGVLVTSLILMTGVPLSGQGNWFLIVPVALILALFLFFGIKRL